MKTFTTTLALVLTATVMMAFPRGSQLTIEVVGHTPNTMIVLNGQQYNSANNVVRLEGLAPGNYSVKVLRNSYWGNQGVAFSGNIRVPHRSDVTAVINRRGMKVDAIALAHQGGSYWDNNGIGSGYHHAPNPNGNGGFVSMMPTCEPVIEPVVCGTPVMVGMHPNSFEGALQVIESQTFDSDQIRVAKQIIRSNAPSSHQIAQIMELMSFESSRLKIAKFGYGYVADPQNYFVVNDVFWFSSSIRELDRYINQY